MPGKRFWPVLTGHCTSCDLARQACEHPELGEEAQAPQGSRDRSTVVSNPEPRNRLANAEARTAY